jgi:hypothetical protein
MTANGSEQIARRRVLRAAIGGAVAATVAAVSAPASVLASSPVNLGEGNAATATTGIACTGPRALDVSSTAGDGIRGWSDGDHTSGVMGYATNSTGYGVYGKNGGRGAAALGTYSAALWASTAGYAAPLAMRIEGRAQFTRSGVVTIAKNKRSMTLPVAPVTAATFGIATVQQLRTGLYVQCVVRSGTSLVVYLNKAATAATRIGWIAFETP